MIAKYKFSKNEQTFNRKSFQSFFLEHYNKLSLDKKSNFSDFKILNTFDFSEVFEEPVEVSNRLILNSIENFTSTVVAIFSTAGTTIGRERKIKHIFARQ